MIVYHEVVRDNRIELEGDARLGEGTRVEVHAPPAKTDDMAAAEDQEKARLRAAGLLAMAPPADHADEDDDFEPVIAQGELLSEQIIRERC